MTSLKGFVHKKLILTQLKFGRGGSGHRPLTVTEISGWCCVFSSVTQVVSQYSGILSPIIVDAIMKVIDPATATNVDLHDIKVIQKIGWVRHY